MRHKAFKSTAHQGMQRLLATFLAAGMVMFASAVQATEQAPDLVQVTPSPLNFTDTLASFRKEVSNEGWSILNENDMAGVLKQRGHDILPVTVIDVCSGQYSARILENDEYRPISAFMPCRVSIYEDRSGQVYIARMNVPAFLPMLPSGAARVMEESSVEIEAIIKRTVER